MKIEEKKCNPHPDTGKIDKQAKKTNVSSECVKCYDLVCESDVSALNENGIAISKYNQISSILK